MSKKTRVLLIVLVALLLLGTFIWWQIWLLGNGLRHTHANGASDVVESVLAAQVLDQSLTKDQRLEPLVEQYRNHPEQLHEQALLVTTWTHAAQMFRSAHPWNPSETSLSSAEISEVAPNFRMDAWGSPYCIFLGKDRIVFVSGGGKRTLQCDDSARSAQYVAESTSDARLRDVDGAFVVAFPLSKKP